MKRLPLDTSSFRKIREEKWAYVDKTQWIYKLIIDHNTPERLMHDIERHLSNFYKESDLEYSAGSIVSVLHDLIIGLYKKTGRRVVVLIDEYDRPVITHLGLGDERLRIAKENSDILKTLLAS